MKKILIVSTLFLSSTLFGYEVSCQLTRDNIVLQNDIFSVESDNDSSNDTVSLLTFKNEEVQMIVLRHADTVTFQSWNYSKSSPEAYAGIAVPISMLRFQLAFYHEQYGILCASLDKDIENF